MIYSFDQIKEIVMQIVKKVLDNSELDDVDVDLFDTYELDSLMLVDLIINFEEKFEFEFSDDELDIDNFRTINKIAEVLYRKISE